jgi:hypothetical protein
MNWCKQDNFEKSLLQQEYETGGPITADTPRRLLHRDIVSETGLLLQIINIVEKYLVNERRENTHIILTMNQLARFDDCEEELKLFNHLDFLTTKNSEIDCYSNSIVREIATKLILFFSGIDNSIVYGEYELIFYWNGTSASPESEIYHLDFPSIFWHKANFSTCTFINNDLFLHEKNLSVVDCDKVTTSLESFDLIQLTRESSIILWKLERSPEYKCCEIGNEFFYFISENDEFKKEKLDITFSVTSKNNLSELLLFRLMKQFKINPHHLFFLA